MRTTGKPLTKRDFDEIEKFKVFVRRCRTLAPRTLGGRKLTAEEWRQTLVNAHTEVYEGPEKKP